MKKTSLCWLGLGTLLLSFGVQAANWGKIKTEDVAWVIQDAVTGQVLSEHQANKPMNPASTMKLMTAYAALQTLGPNFTWQTQLQSYRLPENGVLNADLIWQGSGNPTFDENDLKQMLASLQEKGVKDIQGQLILSGASWQQGGSAAGFDHDKDKSFTTPPDSHMLNYKVAWLAFDTNEKNLVRLTSPVAVDISSQIKIQEQGSCANLSSYIKTQLLGNTLMVKGNVPKSCQGQLAFVNIYDNKTFAAKSFVGQWQSLGGQGMKGYQVQEVQRAPYILATHTSKPLQAALTDMNKHSNNIIARTVFLNLSRQEAAGGSVEKSNQIMRDVLQKNGIDSSSLVLENGSGLSRDERVSAKMMANMLHASYQSPLAQNMIDTLPVGGEKGGTLSKRFVGQSGQYLLKTGTLENVRALAGYWFPDASDSGKSPLVVVVILNESPYPNQLEDLDKAVSQLIGEVNPT